MGKQDVIHKITQSVPLSSGGGQDGGTDPQTDNVQRTLWSLHAWFLRYASGQRNRQTDTLIVIPHTHQRRSTSSTWPISDQQRIIDTGHTKPQQDDIGPSSVQLNDIVVCIASPLNVRCSYHEMHQRASTDVFCLTSEMNSRHTLYQPDNHSRHRQLLKHATLKYNCLNEFTACMIELYNGLWTA